VPGDPDGQSEGQARRASREFRGSTANSKFDWLGRHASACGSIITAAIVDDWIEFRPLCRVIAGELPSVANRAGIA
jgi:hypothetical protein